MGSCRTFKENDSDAPPGIFRELRKAAERDAVQSHRNPAALKSLFRSEAFCAKRGVKEYIVQREDGPKTKEGTDEKHGAGVISHAAEISRRTTSSDKAGRIIMATGRGGTGKSTFVALTARYLKSPMLLLDLDPDLSLGEMLGIDLEKTKVTTEIGREIPIDTISDLMHKIEDEDAFTELGGSTATKKIPMLLEWYTTYQSDRFDLITLGTRWTKGDYRSASFLFEFVIPSIGEKYSQILVDSPAGLEHLNRRVVPRVNDLFLVLDPSHKSIKHVERVKRITAEVGMEYNHLYIVGNHEFDHEAEQYFKRTGETYLGRMDYDANVREYNLKGKSLLDLPDDSPACLSLKRILETIGYEKAP